MKLKTIPCHVCGGYGFVCNTGDHKICSEMCHCCHGKGTESVPVTNADRIRSMSDEELAEFLCAFKDCSGKCMIGSGVKDCSNLCATKDSLAIWLQQPAEEDDNA